VLDRLKNLDWGLIAKDVSPFVQTGFDLRLLSLETLTGLLKT
jgi:hypothetical protein